MIEIRHVDKWYGQHQALQDCNTHVAKGEIAVVCGPAGAGKSTLMKCVNALERIDKGTIVVDGVSVDDPKADLPCLRARVGMVGQEFALFPHLSVRQNLELAQRKVLRRRRKERRAKTMQVLEQVGLAALARAAPARLMADQRQRIAIARALAMDPAALLFDEPTSALDPAMMGDLADVMTALAKGGTAIMVATHEMGFAHAIANRVIVMEAGRIVEDTTHREFFSRPRSDCGKRFLKRFLKR